MKKQFDNVNSQCSAPMGRRSWPNSKPETARSTRLFRVRLDSGGYDDGGAYWGLGQPLFCATDGADYREFTRATSRFHAAALLDIPLHLLIVKCPMPAAYTIAPQWRGHPEQRYCVYFRNELLTADPENYSDACAAVQAHYLERAK